MKAIDSVKCFFSRLSRLVKVFCRQKVTFNYVYFGVFFFLLAILNILHLSLSENTSLLAKSFFFFYSMGEVSIEISIFVILAVWLKRVAKPWIYLSLVSLSFLVLFVQTVEFFLVKIMDVSLGESLHIAFGADLENFKELLALSDIGMSTWVLLIPIAVLCPLLGALVYQLTNKVSKKRPKVFVQGLFFKNLMVMPFVLFIVDCFFSPELGHEDFMQLQKMLPWKTTFLHEPGSYIRLKTPFNRPSLPQADFSDLQPIKNQRELPNIYILISESLRSDFFDEKVTPNLFEFAQSYIAPEQGYSNANATHNSWFAFFHSKYPMYWSFKDNVLWEEGSLPLLALKKLGYSVNVITSAQLRFYHFDDVLFGKNLRLTDYFEAHLHSGDKLAWESDLETLEGFKKHINQEGHDKAQVYILFFDSTHFNYYWPDDFQAKYHPCEDISWYDRLVSSSSSLDKVKNRYKNSLSFLDSMFFQVQEAIKKRGVFEESVIVFTGDHAEEFKEHGKLFHASNLSEEQIAVPLYFKFGHLQTLEHDVSIASHLDVFPSILDYIYPDSNQLFSFDGQSILRKDFDPHCVSARYNSCNNPCEFLIKLPGEELKLRFKKKSDIFKSDYLKILKHEINGKDAKVGVDEIQHFQKYLEKIFSH